MNFMEKKKKVTRVDEKRKRNLIQILNPLITK